jgi:dipeptidyl aminopeptidase/acylaminoacyl peptidase
VPLGQSREFFQKLQANGVPAKLVIVKNAEHMLKPNPPGSQIEPSQRAVISMVTEFFDQHLNR